MTPKTIATKEWILRSITKTEAGPHEVIFDVDGQPTVRLTINGSFRIEGCRVERVVSPA